MHILYFEFAQETDSFNPIQCDLECFRNWTFREGSAVFDELNPDIPIETAGMLAACGEEGATLVPAISLWSQSAGAVTADVVDLLLEKVRATYEAMPQVDAVFATLHGGTQDTREDDACGYILRKVRQMVGPDTVIATAYDMHANITEEILKNADVYCGYQTYPHQDPYETGYRAAKLGLRKLRGEKFVSAAVIVPMIVPASGYTSQCGYFGEVMARGHRMVEEGQLLDFTVFMMQPWLDVNPAGTTVVAVGQDAAVAARCAEALAQQLFDGREQYWPRLKTMDEVIDIALENDTGKPVILANSGDSPNGGAVGDSVGVLARLLERRAPLRFATIVRDGAAADEAFRVGVGNEAEFTIGHCYRLMGQVPLRVRATVRSLSDGDYRMEGPFGRGLEQHIGPTATISVGSYDIILCHYPANTGDPQIYRHFGVEPKLYDLVEVKANTSFRLPFSAFADQMYTVDVPGCVGISDLQSLPFTHIPRPFYPFDALKGYQVEKARMY